MRVVEKTAASEIVAEERWYTYGEACISLLEKRPARLPARSLPEEFERRPVLFFLHGRLASREAWRAVEGDLAANFRCLGADLPGFGRSFAVSERGFTLLEHVSLLLKLIEGHLPAGQKTVLIGHDTGAALAELCAREIPERMAGLVLLNGSCLHEEVIPVRTSRNGWMMRWRLKRLLRACRKLPLELERLIEEPWRPRRSRRALRESLHAIEDSWPGPYERQLWRRELCEIPCPVLVLWGGRDRLNPSRRATELLQLLPEAYLFEDEASGHWPMLENPDWVIEKVREFIFQLAEAAPELSRARRSLSR